jgi:hypothetical protein
MRNKFLIVLPILLLQLGASAQVYYKVSNLFLQNDSTIMFQCTERNSTWFKVRTSSWGAELFDKAHAILQAALLNGCPIEIHEDQVPLSDGTWELNSILITPPITPPAECYNNPADQFVTRLRSLEIKRSARDVFVVTTQCSGRPPFNVRYPKIGAPLADRIFALFLTSITKGKKVWFAARSESGSYWEWDISTASIFWQ